VAGAEDYADEIIDVTVPVTVPAGQFAMGFIYDEAAGTLQGMNTVAQDAGSITLATRHFSKFLSALSISLCWTRTSIAATSPAWMTGSC